MNDLQLEQYIAAHNKQAELIDKLKQELDAALTLAEIATKARDDVKKELEEIEQILAKALGYPWFKDDQENFPNATEADGVAVGDHTAWSLACEAADKIKEQKEEISGLHAELEYYRGFAEQLGAKKAVSEKEQYKDILEKILREFPVGNITEHTIESLPGRISYYLKELTTASLEAEAWENCADNLIAYAHGFVNYLSTRGIEYEGHDKQIKLAEDAIEEYNRLKNNE